MSLWKTTGTAINRFTPPARSNSRRTRSQSGSVTSTFANCRANNSLLMNNSLNRRQFIRQTAAATGAWIVSVQAHAQRLSPNEKMNIGMIGVANRAGADLQEVSTENIVALCDIDDNYLAAVKEKYPSAKTYNDFRRLLDQKDIDAMVIGTPDHTHAVAAVAALKSGRHVYCEKPLARTVSETRIIARTASEQKRVTQIGTQIHAGSNYRRVVELVQSGGIGSVREVHVWVDATYGGMDLPHWALELSRRLTVGPVDGAPVDAESAPPWLIVRYEYPARGVKPAVRL